MDAHDRMSVPQYLDQPTDPSHDQSTLNTSYKALTSKETPLIPVSKQNPKRQSIMPTQLTEMEFHLMDANTPLNVELRAFIESHFKCTIMNVKLIFRLGFGVKSQNIRGRRCMGASHALDLAMKKHHNI